MFVCTFIHKIILYLLYFSRYAGKKQERWGLGRKKETARKAGVTPPGKPGGVSQTVNKPPDR